MELLRTIFEKISNGIFNRKRSKSRLKTATGQRLHIATKYVPFSPETERRPSPKTTLDNPVYLPSYY